MRAALDGTPKDLMDAATTDEDGNALGLDASTTYTIQAEVNTAGAGQAVQVSGPFVHVHDAGAAAPNTRQGRKVRHLETIRAQAGDDGTLWAWVTSGRGAVNVYEDI